jgi:hypothetical protein
MSSFSSEGTEDFVEISGAVRNASRRYEWKIIARGSAEEIGQ